MAHRLQVASWALDGALDAVGDDPHAVGGDRSRGDGGQARDRPRRHRGLRPRDGRRRRRRVLQGLDRSSAATATSAPPSSTRSRPRPRCSSWDGGPSGCRGCSSSERDRRPVAAAGVAPGPHGRDGRVHPRRATTPSATRSAASSRPRSTPRWSATSPCGRPRRWASVRRSGAFSVNVLGEHQVELARLFADRTGEAFDRVRWEAGARGCPHLVGAVAVLDCDVDQVLTVGDHELVIGRVAAATVRASGRGPLLFSGGRFRALSPGTPARLPGLAGTTAPWERPAELVTSGHGTGRRAAPCSLDR